MRLKLHCHILPIPQRELDFDANVADKIALQLSLNCEEISTWNTYGAPNLEQAKAYFYRKLPGYSKTLTPDQVNRLTVWLKQNEA